MNSLTNFKGVLSPIPTPFDENGNLYEMGIVNLLTFLKKNGVDGVFALGSYGSFPLLEVEERKIAMKLINDVCKDLKLYTIFHIGHARTKYAVELAQYASEIDADSISSISPYYYSGHAYRWVDILNYHKTVLNSTDLPYCVYNNPRTTSFTITPENLLELAELGVSGLKDSGNDLDRYTSYMSVTKGYNFNCMPGSGSTMLDAFLLGARAIVAGTSVVYPNEVVNLYKAITNGESYESLTKLQEIVTNCRARQESVIMRPAAAYILLKEQGVDIGYPISPWPTVEV
jgi:dihydrodipicolinate synthase/N-acetylneuraminate lyase